MRFVSQVSRLAPALGMAVLLSGCTAYQNSTSFLDRTSSGMFEGVANLGSFMPWGGTRPLSPGDSLTVQRDISFDLYFKSDTDRTAFASYAGTHGFDVTVPNSDQVSKGTQMPYELTISKYSYVKMDGMVAMTEEIKQQVRQHHGVYGGWIAPLNKEQKK